MGKKRTSDAKKNPVSSVFHHFKQAHSHGHENTSLRAYSETHAHMHTKSHNRCLVSGVLYLYDNGLVWASAKQLSLHLSQNPSLL